MNEKDERIFCKATQTLQYRQDAPVIVEGHVYEGVRERYGDGPREYTVRLLQNEHESSHYWPFASDFEEYFDVLPDMPGIFVTEWQRADDPECDRREQGDLGWVLGQFPWLMPFLFYARQEGHFEMRIDYGLQRLRVEYLDQS